MSTALIEGWLVFLNWGILIYFLAINGFYGVLLLSAAWEIRRHVLTIRGESRWKLLSSRVVPSITVLAPAHNEASTIAESVRALLGLYYPNLEVIVINDGSSDQTIEVLQREFDLIPIHSIFHRRLQTRTIKQLYRSQSHPSLLVADKEKGGKADALNAGLNLATGDLVCAIDADTMIEPDALQRMVRPFLTGHDVVAAGGTIRVVNGSSVLRGRVVKCRVPPRPLAGMQHVEYLRAFLFGRLGWNSLGGNMIISGAFGLFKRQAVMAVGGYTRATVAEDMEIVVKIRRLGYEQGNVQRIEFIPDPVAWTEVPESFLNLGRQRDRWHRGLANVLWRHRGLLLNRRYGVLGLVVYPYFVFIEFLAPVVEATGLLAVGVGLLLGAVDIQFAILFCCVAYGFGLILTIATLAMDEVIYRRSETLSDRLLLLAWTLLEPIGYRQCTVYWRLRGLLKFFQGRTDWGVMDRRGFTRSPAEVQSHSQT